MKILVLGDCASTGVHVLDTTITGGYKENYSYTTRWKSPYLKEVIGWYLKNAKNSERKIKWGDAELLSSKAIKYLKEQELANSYWKYINTNVVNLSYNGSTASGHYKNLLEYERLHGRPDIIVVTDHGTHLKWITVHHKGKKYFFENDFLKQIEKNLYSIKRYII